MSALADHAAAAVSSGYGSFQSSVHAEPGGDVHIWWRTIDDLPTQENRDNCRFVIEEDARAFKRQGYNAELVWSEDLNDADLFIRHRKPPNSSDIALLKGAAASTWLRAGWGGSG